MGNSGLNCASGKKKVRKESMPVKIDVDGKVTFDEFKTFLNHYQLGFNNDQILAMFKHCDKDNSGYLLLEIPENTSSTAVIGNAESLLRQLAIRVQMAKDMKES